MDVIYVFGGKVLGQCGLYDWRGSKFKNYCKRIDGILNTVCEKEEWKMMPTLKLNKLYLKLCIYKTNDMKFGYLVLQEEIRIFSFFLFFLISS